MLNVSAVTPSSFPNSEKSSPAVEHSGPRKRHRKWLSCAPCHKHKQRCDRKHPCSRCIAQNRVDQCTYDSDGKRNGSKVDEPTPPVDDTPKGVEPIKKYNKAKGKVRISGATHWAQLVFQFEELRPFLFHVQEFEDINRKEKQFKRMYYRPKPRIFPFGDAMRSIHYEKSRRCADLPPKMVVDMLTDHYFLAVDKLFPLLDTLTFKEELESFWNEPDSVSDAWLAQLYLILALSCYSSPASSLEGIPGGPAAFAKRCIDAAEVTFSTRSFMKRTDLTDIRVLCLIAICKMSDLTPESDNVWTFVGLVTRLGMAMYLHRDPGGFPTMPPREAEARKRIWMMIQVLDLFTSIDAGMQMSCLPEFSDVSAPASNISSTNDGSVDTLDPSNENVYQLRLMAAFPTLCTIVNKVNGPFPQMPYSEVLEYDGMLREALRQTQSATGQIPHNCLNDSQPDWVYLQKTTVNNLLRRVLLALHQSHARDAQESAAYQKSHWTILECALAILRHQRELFDNPHLAWAAEFFKSDFRVAMIHVSLGLRNNYFSDKPEPGATVSAKEVAWDTLRSSFEITRAYIHHSLDHFKDYMGMAVMIGVLESLGSDTPIPEVIRNASEKAFRVVEEQIRLHRPLYDIQISAQDYDGLESMAFASAGMSPYFLNFLDPALFDGSHDGDNFSVHHFFSME